MLKKALLIFVFGLIFPFGFFLLVSGFIQHKSNSKVLGTTTYENPTINRVNIDQKLVALTFDDGPSLETKQIIRVLRSHQVSATFFVVGNKLEKFPEETKWIIEQGHEIGNHSNSHPWLFYFYNQEKISKEFLIAEEKINDMVKVRPKLLRSPYGIYNNNLAAVVDTLQYQLIGWDVDPEDWKRPGADEIVQRVIDNVQPGSIILLHDGPYTADRRQTTEALPQIIEKLWDEGYRFVTVSELIHRGK